MIRAVANPSGVELVARLPAGAVAYLDADWLAPEAPGSPPSLVVVDGRLRFEDGPARELGADADPDLAAARVLLAVADGAAAAVRAGPAEVLGRGLVAERVRSLLGARGVALADGVERPTAIVDGTGDPASLGRATERLADLGMLVLAGEPAGRRVPLNVYTDVHRRGLRVFGVAPPAADCGAEAAAAPAVDPPVHVQSGETLPPALWYRVSC